MSLEREEATTTVREQNYAMYPRDASKKFKLQQVPCSGDHNDDDNNNTLAVGLIPVKKESASSPRIHK